MKKQSKFWPIYCFVWVAICAVMAVVYLVIGLSNPWFLLFVLYFLVIGGFDYYMGVKFIKHGKRWGWK
jgi:hypothetical protein